MKPAPLRIAISIGVFTFGLFTLSANAPAGVSYQDPAGGWRYKLEGSTAIFNDGRINEIDGTWDSNQTDRWDGSGISDGIGAPYPAFGTPDSPDGPAPGGVEARTEGSTTYIRLQDPGNPEPHGYWQDPTDNDDDSNRRLNFGHRLTNDGALDKLVLSNGITVSFRARIPSTGPLDSIYTQDAMGANVVLPWLNPPEADYNSNGVVDAADYVIWRKNLGNNFQLANEVANVTPGMVTQEDFIEWKARFGNLGLGRGYPMHDNARGMFYVVQQNDTLGTDGSIAFSLMTSADAEIYCGSPTGANAGLCANPRGGLVMNNLNGNTASNDVDTFDPGTLNLLEIPDDQLDDWHEFWITIVTNGADPGTHRVNVYRNGSTTPTTFNVTVSGNDQAEYINDAWLAMGLSSSDLFGSVDIDFYAYQLGVISPVAAGAGASGVVPEPSTFLFASLGSLGLVVAGRRRGSG
jgi:hypothetical protein